MEESEGILIRRTVWSDTSLITTWLTERHGKVRLVARSARRAGSPFAGKLDLFYLAEVAFALSRGSSGLHTLREVRLIAPFDAAKVSCANVFLCGYFAELLDLCTEPGQPAPEIFDLLRRAVGHLRTAEASRKALVHFEKELCRLLGISGDRSDLPALESYCGKIPASRAAALALLKD